jgi:hypothetical protein
MMIALAALVAAPAAGNGQAGVDNTVNAVSQTEMARAKAAIQHAGYQPEMLAMAQDHNLFFNATKGGETYEITVTRDGKLYVSTPVPAGERRS